MGTTMPGRRRRFTKGTHIMATRKASLRTARQYRTCPPLHIRKDPIHKEAFEFHQRICPYCRETLDADLGPWAAMVGGLRRAAGPHWPTEDRPPAPGQLRYIRPDLARWRDGFFYTPPLVLLLADLLTSPRAFRVAQTFHDLYLAGPGDLILPEEKSLSEGWFIETWHTYTMKAADLGRYVDAVSPDLLSTVLAMEADPKALPEWAPLPRPITGDHDPRIYFRELEIEVGYTFSAPSVESIIGSGAAPDIRIDHWTVQAVLDRLDRIAPDACLEDAPDDPITALAALRFRPERLPLAAEDADSPVLFANLITLKSGELETVAPLPARIFDRSVDGDRLTMDGRIADLPRPMTGSRLFAFWKPGSKTFLSPDLLEWDEETGSFLVQFNLPDRDAGGVLCMAVVHGVVEGTPEDEVDD